MARSPDIETSSQTWRAVKACCDKGAKVARDKLEQHGHPIEVTEYERGKIKAYREILELAGTPTVIPSTDPRY